MEQYKIEVELLSETIFGSGYAVPGSVDMEVVYDKAGFPYMRGKTFKGNFREAVGNVVQILEEEYSQKHYRPYLNNLFGEKDSGINIYNTLKFSDLTIAKSITDFIRCYMDQNNIAPIEILESLTDKRSFTSIDNEIGAAKEGSLRQMRVIKKGAKYEVLLTCLRKLESEELSLLAMGAATLRHIGSMRTRGKGEVRCRLMQKVDGVFEDQTQWHINRLMEEVKQNE